MLSKSRRTAYTVGNWVVFLDPVVTLHSLIETKTLATVQDFAPKPSIGKPQHGAR